jgi:Ni/Fe-hydrogenase subunit HybB-like protein
MMTPHFTSPMAMFGFVYAWYIMAVLLLELWFDYRRDLVVWGREVPGLRGWIYRVMTVGVTDLSPKALRLDEKMCDAITIIGVPSAFLLHGYVGFIFGSVKANPWWGNVLMPVIFIFSAIVSGMALCVALYYFINWVRRQAVNDACVDEMGKFLFYALLVDASVEGLDWLHRLYSAEESIHILKQLAAGKLFYTLLIGQVLLGTLLPLVLLGSTQLFRRQIAMWVRRRFYLISSLLIVFGVMSMRWNVVIGGQLFSKSLRGFTTYKMELHGQEGWPIAAALMILPFIILYVLIKLFLRADQPTHEQLHGHQAPPAVAP